jgi:hypothetical protein
MRSHCAICASLTCSSGLCATAMLPGPQTTAGVPSAFLEQAAFSAEGDLAGRIAARQRVHEFHRLAVHGRVHRGVALQLRMKSKRALLEDTGDRFRRSSSAAALMRATIVDSSSSGR